MYASLSDKSGTNWNGKTMYFVRVYIRYHGIIYHVIVHLRQSNASFCFNVHFVADVIYICDSSASNDANLSLVIDAHIHTRSRTSYNQFSVSLALMRMEHLLEVFLLRARAGKIYHSQIHHKIVFIHNYEPQPVRVSGI